MAVSKYMSVSVACYIDDSREITEVAEARSARSQGVQLVGDYLRFLLLDFIP